MQANVSAVCVFSTLGEEGDFGGVSVSKWELFPLRALGRSSGNLVGLSATSVKASQPGIVVTLPIRINRRT